MSYFNLLIYRDLKTIFKVISLMVFMLLLAPEISYSQINVPVCQDGVVRIGAKLMDVLYMGANAAPPGHLQKGYWSKTDGLTFSDLNDPYAIISGFSNIPGTTYDLTWYHAEGQTYDITVEVTTDVAPVATLLNADGNATDVVFCAPSPNKYTFSISTNPVGPISSVDYVVFRDDGSFTEVDLGVSDNPHQINLNSYGFEDLDMFQALVDDGTCLDITTNRIRLSEASNVSVRIEGGGSSCDPSIFDGTNSLEVFPFDPVHFNYRWFFNDGSGPVEQVSAFNNDTYTLSDPPGNGSYYAVIEENTGACGPFNSAAVIVSDQQFPQVTINETGPGVYGICNGVLADNLTTSLGVGISTPPLDYDWYHNGVMVAGDLSSYALIADDALAGYNAFGEYVVVYKETSNPECKSISPPVNIVIGTLTGVSITKANNAVPFCLNGTPEVNVTVTGGTAPYTLTFIDNAGNPAVNRVLSTNPGTVSLYNISADTRFTLTDVSDAGACTWSGAEFLDFQVYTSPAVLPTNGNNACVPTGNVNLTLNNPQNGISYQLMRDNDLDGLYDLDVGAVRVGDGVTPMNWGPYTTAGRYKVFASTATCTDIPMDNEFTATQEPVDHLIVSNVAGVICADPTAPVTFHTSGSESGVIYNLYRDYGDPINQILVEARAGIPGNVDVSFTPQSAAGVYTVVATKGGLCPTVMTNSYTISPAPDVATIVLSATSVCENTATTFTLSNSQTGVTYTLYYNDGTGAVATGYTVAGFTGVSRNIVVNQMMTPGVYTVMASNGVCTAWLPGSITILASPTDIPFVTSGFVCNSGSVTLSAFGEPGVTYTLYESGVPVVAYLPVLGNGGNVIRFNGLPPGNYSVNANNGTCSTFLTDVVQVEQNPAAQVVTVPDDNYCANEPAVSIQLASSQAGINYELYNVGTASVVDDITGTGAGLTFTGVVAGTYQVLASNNSCSVVIASNLLITQHPVPTPNANIPAEFCSDQGVQTLYGSPSVVAGSSTGQYTVIGGAGFDPGAVADPNAGSLTFNPANSAFETTFSIRYRYTDGNGCIVEDIGTTIVHDLAGGAISISSAVPAKPCQDDNTDYVLQGLRNLAAVAGTFSSTSSGLKNIDPVAGTAKFNPFEAGNGVHTVNFDYVDAGNNCTGNATIVFTIGTPLSLPGFGTRYCSSDKNTYSLDGDPNGGIFKVFDPTNTIIASGIADGTSWLNPSTLFETYGSGTYNVEYTYDDGSCVNILTTAFELIESLDPSFNIDIAGGEPLAYCKNDAIVTLTPANALPGTATAFFSGNGVSGNSFDPSAANLLPGLNTVTYTVTNRGYCASDSSKDVSITALPVIWIDNLLSDYCDNEGAVSISANNTGVANAVYTLTSTKNAIGTSPLTIGVVPGTAKFDPSMVGDGGYTVTYTFDNSANTGCISTYTQDVKVHQTKGVGIEGLNADLKYCEDASDVALSGSFDATGIFTGEGFFTGDGVTDVNLTDGVATFSPSATTIGNHILNYTYKELLTPPTTTLAALTCTTTASQTVEIKASPTVYNLVSNPAHGHYCPGSNVVIGLDDTQAGGNYDYYLIFNGDIANPVEVITGNGSAMNFAPVTAVGNYSIQAINRSTGCSIMMNGNSNVIMNDIVLTPSSKDAKCNGGKGEVSITATGGTAPYIFSWATITAPGVEIANTYKDSLFSDNYQVTVTDFYGCSITSGTITIGEPANALIVSDALIVNNNCPVLVGDTPEGSATISISGGTPFVDLVTYPTGYDIKWESTGNSGLTEIELSGGTHKVTVTDNSGCAVKHVVTIGLDANLNVSLSSKVHNICNGGGEGEIIVSGGGGSGDYQFRISSDGGTTWSTWIDDVAGSYTFTNLTAGNYDIEVVDEKATNDRCTASLATVTINEPAALTLSEVAASHVDETCIGLNDGQLEVVASGGIAGNYEYSIDGGGTWVASPLFTGLSDGSYSIWVRDLDNVLCVYQGMPLVEIAEPDALSLSLLVKSNVTCNNSQDGSVSLLASGNRINYDYSINGGTTWQSSNTFTIPAAGTYNFSVRDRDIPTCTAIDILTNVKISEPLGFVGKTTESNVDVLCNGGSTGSIVLGTAYSDNSTGSFDYSIDGQVTWQSSPITNLSAGTYLIDVKDNSNGCIETDQIAGGVVISEPALPLAIGVETISNISCHGLGDGSIDLTGNVTGGTGANVYTWFKDNLAPTPDVVIHVGDENPTNLLAGNYYLKVRDANLCTVTSPVYTISEPSPWGVTFNSSDVTSNGNNDGFINVTNPPTGQNAPYTISWADGPTTWSRNNLVAGDYVFTITDANACTYVETVTITEPDLLAFSLTPNDATCYGKSDGDIQVEISSGNPDFKISLTGEDYLKNSVSLPVVSQTTTTYTFSNLVSGTYSVTIEDGAGAKKTHTTDVNHLAKLSVSEVSSSSATCFGYADGTLDVEVLGRAINNNLSTINWTRTNPAGWSLTGAVNDGTDRTVQNALTSGDYSVIVEDEYGCVATSLSVTISAPAEISASETITHVSVNGGNDGRIFVDNILSDVGITSIEWNKKVGLLYNSTGVTGADNNNITAGTYQYIVTNASGCTYTSPDIIVTEPGALVVAVTDTDIKCYGSSNGEINVQISSGTAPYTVKLNGTPNDGSPFSEQTSNLTNKTFGKLKPGNYTVDVTDNAGVPFNQANVIISENPATILNETVTDISCKYARDGNIQMLLSGLTNGSESWHIIDPNGATVYNGVLAGNANQVAAIAGDYFVTVTNQDGCLLTETYSVTEPTPWNIIYSKVDVTPTFANNGSVTISTLSGNQSPYSINWSDGLGTDNTIRTNLAAGNYWFTITDNSAACDTTISFVINEPTALTVDPVVVTNALCYSDSNGSIQVNITGGNESYLVSVTGIDYDGIAVNPTDQIITNNTGSALFNGLKAGKYIVNVLDNVGNKFTDNVIVQQPVKVSLERVPATSSDISCFGAADGSISITLNGRLPVASDNITWLGDLGTFVSGSLVDPAFNTLSVVKEETYNVSVTDAVGCTYSGVYTVNEPEEIIVTEVAHVNILCNGNSNGQLAVDVSGREPGHIFAFDWEVWNSGTNAFEDYTLTDNNTASISGLAPGTYRVRVTSSDANSCEVLSENMLITEPLALNLSLSVTDINTCSIDNSGSIFVDVEGGTSPYVLTVDGVNYSAGDGPFNVTSLLQGAHSILVSDNNGCPVSETRTIIAPDAVVVNNLVSNISCDDGASDGSISFDIRGGVITGGNQSYEITVASSAYNEVLNYSVAAGNTQTVTIKNGTGLSAGTYRVRIEDANAASSVSCPAEQLTVTLETISISGTLTSDVCETTNNHIGAIQNIAVSGTSGVVNYSWNDIVGNVVPPLDRQGLSKGTYTLNVEDVTRGCSVSKTFNIGSALSLSIDGNSVGMSCSGVDDGKILNVGVNGSVNYNYAWLGGVVYNPSDPLQDVSGLDFGTYTLNIQDKDNGCTVSRSWDIKEPSPISYNLNYSIVDCDPYERNISMTNLDGGAGNYLFSWRGPGNSFASTENLNGLSAGGDYTVTVTDANACSVEQTISIPREVTISNTVTQPLCTGGLGAITNFVITGGSGDFSYEWRKNGALFETGVDLALIDIIDLEPGVYDLLLTDNVESDGALCTYQETITIAPISSVIQVGGTVDDPICHTSHGLGGGNISLNILGGVAPYSYSWTTINGSGLVTTDKNQSDLTSGNYTVVVKDTNGCKSAPTLFTVTEPDPIQFFTNVVDTQCDGTAGAIQVIPNGGSGTYGYIWRTDDGSGISNYSQQNQSGLSGGTYSVEVYDADPLVNKTACSIEKSVILTKALSITSSVTNQSCSGNANGAIDIVVDGGIAPYTFDWTKDDASGFTSISQNLTGLTAGDFLLTITDSNPSGACTSPQFRISVGVDVDIETVSNTTAVSCFGGNDGSITLVDVKGGIDNNYTYSWSGPGTNLVTTQRNQTGLSAGTYEVTIANGGCSTVETFDVIQPGGALSLTLSGALTHVKCKGEATGSVAIQTATGGTAPYSYIWSGGANMTQDALSQSNLYAGAYTVRAKDDKGCESSPINFAINEPAEALSVILESVSHVTVANGNDGSIDITISGGTGSRSINWTGADGAGNIDMTAFNNISDPSGLIDGTYAVAIIDDNNCSVSLPAIVVNEPGQPLSMVVTEIGSGPCAGSNNGEIRVTGQGGISPYDIEIYNASNGLIASATDVDALTQSSLNPGVYRVELTDANNVTVSNTDVRISEPSALTLTASVTQNVNCYKESTGQIDYSVSGGSPDGGNYQIIVTGPNGYRRQFTNNSNSLTSLAAGEYSILVIDDFAGDGKYILSENCTASSTLTITQPEALVTVSNDLTVCAGLSANLLLSVNNYPVSVANPLEITLSDGTVATLTSVNDNVTVSPLLTTIYTIKSVTDGAACTKGIGAGKASVTVNELPTGFISLLGEDEICIGDQTELNIYFEGTGPWSVQYTDGVDVTEVNNVTTRNYSFNVSPLNTTTYELVSVSDANCTGTVLGQEVITVHPAPSVTMTVDPGLATICRGNNSELIFTVGDNTKNYDITFTEGGITRVVKASPTQFVGNEFKLSISPLNTTTYTLISVKDEKGCRVNTAPNTVIITVNPLPDAAGVVSGDVFVCQGTTKTYIVEPIAHADSYNWTVPVTVGNILSSNANSVTVRFLNNFANGTISVKGVNPCGVGQEAFIGITANPLPDAPKQPSGPTNICQGESGLVYSIDPVANAQSYVWSIPTGLEFVGGVTNGNVIELRVSSGYNTVSGNITVEAVNNCGSGIKSVPLPIQVSPNPVANAGFDLLGVCSTTIPSLSANNPISGSGLWTVEKGTGKVTEVSNPNSEVTNISRGENIFRWTVKNASGCVSYDEVSYVNDQLSVSTSASVGVSCDGSVNVFGTLPQDADGGIFSVTTGSGIVNMDPLYNNFANITELAPGVNTIEWIVTKNACESKASVDVLNNKPTTAEIFDVSGNPLSELSLPCQDTQTNLKASIPVVAEGETGTWSLLSGMANISDLNSPNITLNNIAQGETELSYTIWRGTCPNVASVLIKNNALSVNAGKDRTVCEQKIELSGTPLPDGVNGQWQIGSANFVSGYNATMSTTMVHELDRGANTMTWTLNKNGCLSSDDVVITSHAPTPAFITEGVAPICGGDVKLKGNTPAVGESGYWSLLEGAGSFVDMNHPQTVVRNLAQGINRYQWTILYQGCSTSAIQTITNNEVDVYAGRDTIICDASVVLRGSALPVGTTGEWLVLAGFGGGVLTNPNDSITTVGGLGYGYNGFVWSVTKGDCKSEDIVYVHNKSPYAIDGDGKPIAIDAGDDFGIEASPTTLNAAIVGVGIGRWSLVEGGANIIDAYSPNTQVTDMQVGPNRFRWTVIYDECIAYDEVIVNNGEITQANAGYDQTNLCINKTTMNANSSPVAVGSWSVISGTGVFTPDNSPHAVVTNIAPGENVYAWTLTYADNVTTTDEVRIINNSVSKAFAGIDREVCSDSYVLEAGTPEYGTSTWEIISGGGEFDNINLPGTTVRNLAKGENILSIKIEQGTCYTTDEVTIINNLPSTADAGLEEVSICKDSIELYPSTASFGVGEWIIVEGSAQGDDLINNWAKGLAPGPNVLEWRISSGGCVSSDKITIINNQPSPAFAGGDKEICESQVILSAGVVASDESGTWELVSGGGVIVDASLANSTVTGVSQGRNRFRWTVNKKGCTSSDEVEITNNFIQADAGLSQVLCSDKGVLNGNVAFPGTGSWSVSGGAGAAIFENNTSPYTTVSGLDQGDNILIWTIKNGICTSASQVVITNDSPSESRAGNNLALCDYNTTTLTANVPSVGVGSWSIVNGSASFSSTNPAITDPILDNNAIASNLTFGSNILRWTITKNNCSTFDDIEIKYNRIEAEAGPNQEVCSKDAILEANNPYPGVGTWTVVGNIGSSSQAEFEDRNNPTTTVTSIGQGQNTLRWTINYEGCITESNVVITNNLPDLPYAGNAQVLCTDETTLDATILESGMGVGTWQVLTGSGNVNDPMNPKSSLTGLSKGENVLRWLVQKGKCSLYDEVTITNDLPSVPYAGADETICENFVKLKATQSIHGQGSWSIVEGSGNFDSATNPLATVSNLAIGTNVLRWTLVQGQCALTDDITITNNKPAIPNAGPDIQDCRVWAQLDANNPGIGGGQGRWNLISGQGDFDSESNAKTIIRNLGFGENILQWTISKEDCFLSDRVTITMQLPDSAQAGVDRQICEDYIVLNANDPVDGIGQWTVISGTGMFENSGSYNSRVTNVGYGENKYKWTISYGSCTTNDEVIVTSNKAKPYAGEDEVTYESFFDLQGSNPGKLVGEWSVVAGTGTFDDKNFFNATVSGMSGGMNTYRWTIETDGCIAFDDVTIEYKVVPQGEFIVSEDNGCFPLRVKFTNYSVGGEEFHWDFGDGETSTARNTNHTYTVPGEYLAKLTVTGPDGEDGVFSKTIVVHDHPKAEFLFAPKVVYVPGEEVRFQDLSSKDVVSWVWAFGDGITSSQRSPVYEYSDPGVYNVSLLVTNMHGCENEVEVLNAIEARPAGYVVFPDAFKPRPEASDIGGGLDEREEAYFKPKYKDVEEYNLQIFNRWGQLIFESDDVNEGWDGKYKGTLAPQAVYVWKVTGKFISGREFREAGSVLLVR